VVQRDWARLNASEADIAPAIQQIEHELWNGPNEKTEPRLGRWNGKEFKQNPYLRVSDVQPLMLHNLARDHGLRFANVNKVTGAKTELKEAAVHSVRAAIGRGQVVIDPACTTLIAHLEAAQWNDQRSDYRRHSVHKHFDALDALVYLWRSVARNKNPFPPSHIKIPKSELAAGSVPQKPPLTSPAKALEMLFGKTQSPINKSRPSPIRSRGPIRSRRR
jgi:hypothetical protein